MRPDPRVTAKKAKKEAEKAQRETLLGFLAHFLTISKSGTRTTRKGEPLTAATLRNYQTTYNTLRDFETFQKKAHKLEEIALPFYNDFTAYLTLQKRLSPNSIGKHVRILKTLLKEAEACEIIPPLYQPANGLSLGRYCPGAEKALKLYDKGLQNSLPFPLMRCELRFSKMRELKTLGIRHLSDLLKPSLYPALLEMLLQCWNKLLIGKPFRPEELRPFPPKDAVLLGKGYCRDFWRELRTGEGSDAFTNKRKKYRALLDRQGISIQQELECVDIQM